MTPSLIMSGRRVQTCLWSRQLNQQRGRVYQTDIHSVIVTYEIIDHLIVMIQISNTGGRS